METTPLDSLWRRAAEEDARADEFYALELREQIVEANEKLEVYETAAWAEVEKVLEEEAQGAFRDMLNGDTEQMVLARERARVVAKLRAKPDELRQQLDSLRRKLAEAQGEIDA